jgi:hypothetical protein
MADLTKTEIDNAWIFSCADVRAGIGAGVMMGIKPRKGESAKEARTAFFQELAKIAFEAGVQFGRGK